MLSSLLKATWQISNRANILISDLFASKVCLLSLYTLYQFSICLKELHNYIRRDIFNPPRQQNFNSGLHKAVSLSEWIKKLWHIYTMEYYSAIKRNEIELFIVRWMDLEMIVLSEVSQTE